MDGFLAALDRGFLLLDRSSRELLANTTGENLFAKPQAFEDSLTIFSCGEYLLRSAAMVEKSFGGITTRLWDDPFEWTLPEQLKDLNSILQYLDEVETTRVRGFSFFNSDDDLFRQIPAPEKLTPIVDILLQTLAKGQHFQGMAFAVFQLIDAEKLPKF